MTSLLEAAKAYEPPKTKNIADLQEVTTDIQIMDESFPDENGKEITIQVIEIKGEKYRVPPSVLKALKVHVDANPNLKKFKVVRSGAGLSTTYTVVPIL